MATDNKITKKENYMQLRSLVDQSYENSSEDKDRLFAFIDHEIELLDQRAAKSKKYQQDHRATDDAMTDMIVDVLNSSDGAMSVPDIVAKIVDSTPQKIVYRLGKLYKEGKISKETQSVKIEGCPARKVTFYNIAEA